MTGIAVVPPGQNTSANSLLSKDQQVFATTLAAQLKISPDVAAAWVHAEEPNIASNGTRGANNWLNVGITGSGNYGVNSSVWKDPVSAAHATAQWLEGTPNVIKGYNATPGLVNALKGIGGKSPDAQLSTIRMSGWAASGYPNLESSYQAIRQAGGFKPLSTNEILSTLTGFDVSGSPIPGDSSVVGATQPTIDTVTGAVSGVADAASAVPDFLAKLSNPGLWVRVAEIVGGGILIILGIMQLAGQGMPGIPGMGGASSSATPTPSPQPRAQPQARPAARKLGSDLPRPERAAAGSVHR